MRRERATTPWALEAALKTLADANKSVDGLNGDINPPESDPRMIKLLASLVTAKTGLSAA